MSLSSRLIMMLDMNIAQAILNAEHRASQALNQLAFAEPVTHVYNPLDYAHLPHAEYVTRFAHKGVEALFLGMNPGPFGMAQTGVPFGEIAHVRDWMGINKAVDQPQHLHPKRPIEGFACQRSEVSGQRVWSWAKAHYPHADDFFKRFYVHNYCPLVFMADSGRNITPDKLPKEERDAIYQHCDDLLAELIATLQPQRVIGVGGFAEIAAKRVTGGSLPVHRILHPSPASPAANRDWRGTIEKELEAIGVSLPN